MMRTYFGAMACFFLATTAVAQDQADWQSWPLGDKYTTSLDLFFPRIDTRVRLDATNGTIGTTIDFEQNLGMSDSEILPEFSFSWRFAKKHRLRLDAFNLDRSGSSIAASEIRFGDEVFQVNLPISSFFDTRVTSVGYSYSLIMDEKKELALSAGLSVQDIQFGLIGNGGTGIIESNAGLTAPLPAFGLSGAYVLGEKWVARAGAGVFEFSLALANDDDLSGKILNASLSLEHHTFEHLYFGLSYSYFDVQVDLDSNRRLSSVDYQYRGPLLSVSAAF